MAGYDLVHPGKPGAVLSKKKLEWVVEVLEGIASGKLVKEVLPTGKDQIAFRRIAVEYPEVAEAYKVARQISAAPLEEEALAEARKLLAPNEFSGTRVRAAEVAMNQFRWSAARRDPASYGERAPAQTVVPIQINTTLDIGQAGGGASPAAIDTYTFAGQVRGGEVEPGPEDAEVLPLDPEPVAGAARFGLHSPPKRGVPIPKGGRPRKGHKTAKGVQQTLNRRRPNKGAKAEGSAAPEPEEPTDGTA